MPIGATIATSASGMVKLLKLLYQDVCFLLLSAPHVMYTKTHSRTPRDCIKKNCEKIGCHKC